MMFLAFFARTDPAHSIAKPACMKNTCERYSSSPFLPFMMSQHLHDTNTRHTRTSMQRRMEDRGFVVSAGSFFGSQAPVSVLLRRSGHQVETHRTPIIHRMCFTCQQRPQPPTPRTRPSLTPMHHRNSNRSIEPSRIPFALRSSVTAKPEPGVVGGPSPFTPPRPHLNPPRRPENLKRAIKGLRTGLQTPRLGP